MLWRFGIRAQILLLIGLTAAPLLALLILGASLQRAALLRESERQLGDLVERIADRHADLVREGQVLAALIAAADIGLGEDGRGCIDFFRRLDTYGRTTWRFSRFDRNGALVCAGGAEDWINVRDRPYFREAERTGEPVVGYYLVGRRGGSPRLPLVQPVRDADGQFDGVILASLPFRALRQMLASLAMPQAARLQVVDVVGNLVAERALEGAPLLEPSEWLGHVDPLATSHVARLDGRLVAVSDVAGSGVTIAISVDEAHAMREANRRLAVQLAIALAALLAVGTTAVLFAERAFVRRIQRLAGVARRLRQGDLTARSELIDRGDEIGVLAQGFDGMADDLQRQHRQLVTREAQYRHLAMHDPLTELANRRGFMAALEERVRVVPEQGGGFALLVVDLDGFKEVNDRWGHDVGDALLVAAAGRLRAAVRAPDLVARLAGDEFAVLIDRAPDADLDGIAERLVEQLAEPYALEAATITSAGTVGVATFPDHAGDATALVKAADIALYNAKLAGRRTWRMFDGTVAARAAESAQATISAASI